MDRKLLEEQMSALPIVQYDFFETEELVFTPRVRTICEMECAQYGKSWACPPGVGTVEECRERCLSYPHGLLVVTMTEVEDIADINATLATRDDHEEITRQVHHMMLEQGAEVAKTPSTSLEELLVLEAMLNDHFGDIPLEPVTDSALYFNPVDEEDYRPLLLLLDHNSNVVGMCNSYDGGDTVVFTRTNIQAVSLLEEFLAQVDARLARKDQVEVAVDTSDPQGGWNDGTGMAYHYPVYIDGEELAGDYWLALDLDYQWKLDGIQNNGGSFDTYLEYMMSNLLLGGSMITMTDDNGREHSYGELSEEYQSIYAYDEHWDRDGNLISARYGLYTSAQRSQPLFVGVCDKEGNLLGYTILEATK